MRHKIYVNVFEFVTSKRSVQMRQVRWAISVAVLAIIVLFTARPALAQGCAKIKDGTITDSVGNQLSMGYDKYGYNYQAHMFNGLYDNFSRPATPVTEGAVSLIMKWSNDWLSNLDCNGDGKLDRGGAAGADANISKGWLTNHEEGDYVGGDGESHHYTYFVKIVWVGPPPAGDDPWADKRIWDQYAVIEEVYNDPYGGHHGVDRSRLVNPAGLGFHTNGQ